jgi:hypothetical protein
MEIFLSAVVIQEMRRAVEQIGGQVFTSNCHCLVLSTWTAVTHSVERDALMHEVMDCSLAASIFLFRLSCYEKSDGVPI